MTLSEISKERRNFSPGRQVAEILLDTRCFQIGNFKFASGIPSPMKIEMDYLRLNTNNFQHVIRLLIDLIKINAPTVDTFIAVPRGGVPFADGLSFLTNKEMWVRPKGIHKDQYTEHYERPFRKSPMPNAVIVDDVVTKGTSSGKTILEYLRETENARVLGVATVFTYSAVDSVQNAPVWALCTFDDLIEGLKDRPDDSAWVPILQNWHKETFKKAG